MRKLAPLFITLVLFSAVGFSTVKSSNVGDVSFGISSNISVNDDDVKDNDIITATTEGYRISSKEYEAGIYGLISLNPAVSISFKDPGQDNNISAQKKYPLITSGNAYAKVSGANGQIKKGDLITTSPAKGIGMKATKSGYVLGSALDDFISNSPDEVKKINISLNIHYYSPKVSNVGTGFADILKLSAIASLEEPLQALKYLLAATVIIVSFILGFLSFGRMARSGIEAMGRNPMARGLIQFGILVNTGITVAIIAGGLIIGFLIIKI